MYIHVAKLLNMRSLFGSCLTVKREYLYSAWPTESSGGQASANPLWIGKTQGSTNNKMVTAR